MDFVCFCIGTRRESLLMNDSYEFFMVLFVYSQLQSVVRHRAAKYNLRNFVTKIWKSFRN